ncbi:MULTISPECIES: hypothetical protein [unclassified Streptomyces]|uniref:Uncharacterized protein n=1 Tax=Streptomyces sp. NBC_00060 TaxID=2975636 RepID=A0AAU2HG43_9ACTN
MTPDEALQQFRRIALGRALGRHVGSDRLIQLGLDALLAGVESPSLAMLAGLVRGEEPEAPGLFDQVLWELDLSVEVPDDPRAAQWALAYWAAEQIVDGTLDPTAGAWLIWYDVAYALGYPKALEPLGHCALLLDSWDEGWSTAFESLERDTIQAAREFLGTRPPGDRRD